MHTILLVDDDPIIAEIITNILWVYIRKHKIEFNVLTANNGQKAVDICKSQKVDLIYMDINMPVMHGIDATKEIKKIAPSVMIIALSSVKSEMNQQKIIDAGADDYIKKPITSVIFESRLNSYLSILNSKKKVSFHAEAKNLFTSDVYSHNFTFFINNEDELAHFWETCLVKLSFLQTIEHINDLIHIIFDLGSFYLKNGYKFEVFIEESEDNHYFTLTNATLIPENFLAKSVEKKFPTALYSCKNNRLSFCLFKESDTERNSEPKKEPSLQTPAVQTPAVQTPEENIQEVEVLHSLDKEEYHIYNFLVPDDIEELEDNLYKLNANLSVLHSRKCTINELNLICELFQRVKSILSHENESYIIANAVGDLILNIQNNDEEFIKNIQDLLPIILGFVDDLILWKEMTFFKGTPSIDFMNDSILSNAKIIQDLLHPVVMSEADMNDIFDF